MAIANALRDPHKKKKIFFFLVVEKILPFFFFFFFFFFGNYGIRFCLTNLIFFFGPFFLVLALSFK